MGKDVLNHSEDYLKPATVIADQERFVFYYIQDRVKVMRKVKIQKQRRKGKTEGKLKA